MTALAGALALLLAALLPDRLSRAGLARRGLGALGVLGLVPAAGASGTWPLLVLAAAAAAVATPLPLALAAAGAVVVALRPAASAPLTLGVTALATVAALHGLDGRARRGRDADASAAVLLAGLLLALLLALVDGGAVLAWSFGVGTGAERVPLAGVGVALGAALLAATGGVLLRGGAALAPPAPGARKASLWALGGAVACVILGSGVALARLLSLPEGVRRSGARPLALLVGAAGVLAVLLAETRGSRPEGWGDVRRAVGPGLRWGATLALAAVVAAGVEGWWRAGTYATGLTAASAAAAFLGLAALEPLPRLAVVPHLLFAGTLVFLLFA